VEPVAVEQEERAGSAPEQPAKEAAEAAPAGAKDDAEASSRYSVTFDKTKDNLGMSLDISDPAVLQVTAINDDGLGALYNKSAAADKKVAVGMYIVSVNGQKTSDLMGKELKETTTLQLVIQHDVESKHLEAHAVLVVVWLTAVVEVRQAGLDCDQSLAYQILDLKNQFVDIVPLLTQVVKHRFPAALVPILSVVWVGVLFEIRIHFVYCIIGEVYHLLVYVFFQSAPCTLRWRGEPIHACAKRCAAGHSPRLGRRV